MSDKSRWIMFASKVAFLIGLFGVVDFGNSFWAKVIFATIMLFGLDGMITYHKH